jgi:hypothetical protein
VDARELSLGKTILSCGDISGGWWANHILRERTQNYRARVPVTVTIEYAWDLFLKQDKKCALSGISLEISGTGKYNTASIDRIDSSKGYEPDNVQWVHKDINFMKGILSQEYFIDLCRKIHMNNIVELDVSAKLLSTLPAGGTCELNF